MINLLITKREVREQQERIQTILDDQDAYRVDGGDGFLPAHARSDYCYGGEYLFRGVHSPHLLDGMTDPHMHDGYITQRQRENAKWTFHYLYDEFGALKYVLSSEETRHSGIERITCVSNSAIGVLWDMEGNVRYVAIQDFDERLRQIRFVHQSIERGFLNRLFFGQLKLTEYQFEGDQLQAALDVHYNKYSNRFSGGVRFGFRYGVNAEVFYTKETMGYFRDSFQPEKKNMHRGNWSANPALFQTFFNQHRLLYGIEKG
jgi:hypothetical protein